MREPLEVEVWADVVCPWCYIGKRRFEAALSEFAHRDDVRVTMRSFELDPTPRSAVQGDIAEMLAAKYGMSIDQAHDAVEGVRQTAAQVGIDMDNGQRFQGNTRDAHRLLHYAAEVGMQDRLSEALYRAHFTLGDSVFDHATLADLAEAAGLDRTQAERVLSGMDYDDDVAADEDLARSLGINGVPFFVFDRRLGVSGAQPVELMREALEQAWAAR